MVLFWRRGDPGLIAVPACPQVSQGPLNRFNSTSSKIYFRWQISQSWKQMLLVPMLTELFTLILGMQGNVCFSLDHT
jgi:hypothetical protein